MERFNALGRGAQLMLVGAVLLFIDLFLPWQDFDVGGLADELGVDATFSGWRGIGFIVGLLTIVVLAWLIVRLASVNIPLPVSTAMTGALLGTLILVFTIIKLLTILGDEATLWAWVGVALAVLIAVGAFMTVQEAGGVDTLKSEASSYGGSGSTEAAAPAAPVATAPAAAAPPDRRGAASTRPRRECSGRGHRGGFGRDRRRAVDRAGELTPPPCLARPRRRVRRRGLAVRAQPRTACKPRIPGEGEYPVTSISGPAAARSRSHAERDLDGEVQEPLARHADRPRRRPAPVLQLVSHVAERRRRLRTCRHRHAPARRLRRMGSPAQPSRPLDRSRSSS